jgi:L-amino acid N-acyltransferase YncA
VTAVCQQQNGYWILFYEFEHFPGLMKIELEQMLPAHSKEVLAIYQEGIYSGNATFNTIAPSWDEWDKSHHLHSRTVAVEDGKVIGWVALLPVSARTCYSGVAEFSIYISLAARGKGVGKLLMERLISDSEAHGIWTVYSATLQENSASIALQKKFGFRIIGTRERIAKLNGVWRSTVIMERRSEKVGLD